MTQQTKTTRSKSVCHNGSTGRDINPTAIYEITFRYTQWGIRYIKAASPSEARTKAKNITGSKGFWQDFPETFDIEEILVIAENEMPKDAVILKD
jgi:hypothetical protein